MCTFSVCGRSTPTKIFITGTRTGKLSLASWYLWARRGVPVPVGPRSHFERAGKVRLPVWVVKAPYSQAAPWQTGRSIGIFVFVVNGFFSKGGDGGVMVPSLSPVRCCTPSIPGLVDPAGGINVVESYWNQQSTSVLGRLLLRCKLNVGRITQVDQPFLRRRCVTTLFAGGESAGKNEKWLILP